jgi:ribosomal protein L40E
MLAAPFLEGLARGELRYQVCRACEAPQTLARYACRNCGSTRLDEGPRVLGHAAAGAAIGDRVVAEYFAFGGRNVVRFRPV